MAIKKVKRVVWVFVMTIHAGAARLHNQSSRLVKKLPLKYAADNTYNRASRIHNTTTPKLAYFHDPQLSLE